MLTITEIKNLSAEYLGVPAESISLHVPPLNIPGEFSISLFDAARKKRVSPQSIAEKLTEYLKSFSDISFVSSINGYVNFRVSDSVLQDILENVLIKNFVGVDFGLHREIMVEYFSPNTNKPLHAGHLRNIFIGDALCNLFEYTGFKPIRANVYNDRGIHICKAQLAYEKWGNNYEPSSTGKKGDHFAGDFYVMFGSQSESNPGLEDEAQILLQRWENNDQEVVENWKKIRGWVLDGFKVTLNRLGIKPFDVIYMESDYWREGVTIIKDGLNKGIFETGENGTVIVKLDQQVKPLLRGDGTALYLTQDVFLACKKLSEYPNIFRNIYVVAAEQTEHFKALFDIIKLMGYEWWEKCYHLVYGMILIKGGKLKSREGITADADSILDELENIITKELIKRNPELGDEDIKFRASKIALAAIKWEFLKVNSLSNINFNPEKSLDLKGDTGPYMLYTYARICSLKRKAIKQSSRINNTEIPSTERELISLLYFFPQIVIDSAAKYNFSNLCTYLYQIAAKFNAIYQDRNIRILDDNELSRFRLHLSEAVGTILKEGLNILGIEVIEEI